MAKQQPRQINRLVEPQTKRRRIPREVFGYPGAKENYLGDEPDRPQREPGDPAALERLSKARSYAQRYKAGRMKPGR